MQLCLLPSRQIHADKDHDPAYDLVDAKGLAEEHDTRRNPHYGDEVLVDEHPVRPDTTYAPLPGRERECRGEDGGVADSNPGSCSDASPIQFQELRGGEEHQEGDPEQNWISRDGERRVPRQ